jgi:tellurium resistance protein TerD
MSQLLQKGANISLTKTAPACNEIIIEIHWLKKPNDNSEFDIDGSAFMLAETNKIQQ